MAGSHRAAVPARPNRTPVAALAVVLLVAAVIAGVFVLADSDDGSPRRAAPTRTPSATASLTPSSLPTVTASLTPSPSPRTSTAPALPRVQPAAPRRIAVRGVLDTGFDNAIAPRDGLFRPASTAEVARWGGRGVPSSPGTDTVYVVGKVTTGGAFARLPAVRRGDRISLYTDRGVLTYTVQAAAEKASRGLTRDPGFTQVHRGRLQLVGVRYDADGNRAETVLVVTAQLTAARPRS